ncbi:hypothetical protein [Serratia marcescens]|uniref:hypothetical protein n=1 Tax=Serratia marcescens TaxID=615 RepID=UPI00092A1D71|nr:hypothetical protein [Serratia marcescens]OJH83084.1 hypothetical protein ASJ78_03589 [Serratia marcescens]
MPKNNAHVRLELSDHGQDFLWFIVHNGVIAKAGPFQNRIWSGKAVLNAEFIVGQQVELLIGGERRFINYPIESVTVLDGLEPKSNAIQGGSHE